MENDSVLDQMIGAKLALKKVGNPTSEISKLIKKGEDLSKWCRDLHMEKETSNGDAELKWQLSLALA